MSYRLEDGEPLGAGIRRLAREQVDQAIYALRETSDRDEAVHGARKRFRKIRAALRLVRGQIGTKAYHRENAFYRDAGRELAAVRDALVGVHTLDRLTRHYEGILGERAFQQCRDLLGQRHARIARRDLLRHDLRSRLATRVEAARLRIDEWSIEDEGFDAIRDDLRCVYRRGRKAMAEAYEAPDRARFHEWRKRAKYLWFQSRILAAVWPGPMDALANELHDLADVLGEANDCASLARLLDEEPALSPGRVTRSAILGLLERRWGELRAAARPDGERIWRETGDAFVERMAGYWDAWRAAVPAGARSTGRTEADEVPIMTILPGTASPSEMTRTLDGSSS